MGEIKSCGQATSDAAFIERHFMENQYALHNLAKYRLLDKNRADDVVQETYLIALPRIGILRNHPNPGGWFVRTAMNIIKQYNHQQQKLLEDLFAEIDIVDDGGICEVFDDGEMECLSELSPSDVKILAMFYGERLSGREIAQNLGIKESAVKNRLSRARVRLKKQLDCHTSSNVSI
ncbi:MAG: sigma-70 family RNA polymerase sigma factor [Oscillospiraceae bacterium]|jgi:RNA polymerase sigma-70 factor (ECF subfamily)|nr:sigma-70 family RNA polymerase sigma factor [Oscillospiraceae bacterium]